MEDWSGCQILLSAQWSAVCQKYFRGICRVIWALCPWTYLVLEIGSAARTPGRQRFGKGEFFLAFGRELSQVCSAKVCNSNVVKDDANESRCWISQAVNGKQDDNWVLLWYSDIRGYVLNKERQGSYWSVLVSIIPYEFERYGSFIRQDGNDSYRRNHNVSLGCSLLIPSCS